MTTEREEALELAREAGLETRTLNSIDPDEIVVDQVIITDEIERLVRLAKQRGAEEQKQLERELSALRALIADDSYAMTFQSMGQYRTALLRAMTHN